MRTWARGSVLVVAGAAALVAGAWWGLVRDDAPRARSASTASPAVDVGEVIDLVPGCRADTCRVIARRGGFRLEGVAGTLIVVAVPDRCGDRPAVGLHLVTEQRVLWSAEADLPCLDPLGGIETDRTGNAFMAFPAGAHSTELVVLRFRGDNVDDFGSLDHRFAGDAARAIDLDDDGVSEIVVSVNDCEPDCASGTSRDETYRWNGREYVEA